MVHILNTYVHISVMLLAFLSSLAFVVLAILWIGDDKKVNKLDMVSAAGMSFFALIIGCAFFYYGVKLYILLKTYRLLSESKRVQTLKVVGTAVGCTVCFLTRSGVVLYSIQESLSMESHKDFSVSWPVVFFFFFFLETVPIILMLFLLRKLPKYKADSLKPLLSK